MSTTERKKPGVYFMVPAPPGISPGQRFRFEAYLKFLDEENIPYRIGSFYTWNDWKQLYSKGQLFGKLWIVVKGLLKRWGHLFQTLPYRYVYIYREAAPVGPPFFEWVIAKLFRKRIIYDFDDSIWLPVTSNENRMARHFRFFGKVKTICKWAYKVSVGNDYLGDYARKYNNRVVRIQTSVDTENRYNVLRDQQEGRLAIGWTGTFSTLQYLDIVLPALQQLQETIDFDFVVIAERNPQLPLKKYRFVPWNKTTEIEDLLGMHIGLMPLYDNEVAKGKCGFKAIQYMSLGIPAVVSPVGVNSVIVEDGRNGFVCNSTEDWVQHLSYLLKDAAARKEFGARARKKIEEEYSISATKNLFLELFR